MNLLEQFLINQQQNEKPKFNNILPPQQVEQQNQLAVKLQQSGSPLRAIENFLIHPSNALFGMKPKQTEMPISNYQPLVGIDMTQQDYNNAGKQGLLPDQVGMPITAGVEQTPRIGGLLNDFAKGFNENSQNKFNINNLEPSEKPISTRIGEGLGTFKRFATSPYGAGLLAAGVATAMGGNGGVALANGLKAGTNNQQIKTQDKMYRKALEDNGIDTSNISGYIDGDMYKKYTEGNYKYGQLALGNKRLTHSDYQKARSGIEKLVLNGTYSPEEGQKQVDILNERYKDDSIKSAIEAGNMQESNQTQNTKMRKELLPYQKNALATMPQVAMGNLGINELKVDPNYQATVAGITESAKKQSSNYAKDIDAYNSYVSKMPELKVTVNKLNELADTATYTKVGVAKDSVTRQLGMPVGKGAVARTEYTAMINNQILPLLRETFGAQFTEREGEALRQSLGDVNKSPAEKKAVLDSFIKQKELNIKSQARKVQQYTGGVQGVPTQQLTPFIPNADLTPIKQHNKRTPAKSISKQQTFKSGKYTVTVH